MSYTLLYVIWGAMYALTAVLGFTAPEGALVYVYEILAVLFFVPPWLVLRKAGREGIGAHAKVVRLLGVAWVVVTAGLMAANIMSANWSDAAGNALNAALTIASAPLVCGQMPIISLMLWGILLMGTLSRPGQKRG